MKKVSQDARTEIEERRRAREALRGLKQLKIEKAKRDATGSGSSDAGSSGAGSPGAGSSDSVATGSDGGREPSSLDIIRRMVKEKANEITWQQVAGGAGGAWLAHTIASSMFGDPDDEKDMSPWKRFLSRVIPLTAAGLGGYGGYKLMKQGQDSEVPLTDEQRREALRELRDEQKTLQKQKNDSEDSRNNARLARYSLDAGTGLGLGTTAGGAWRWWVDAGNTRLQNEFHRSSALLTEAEKAVNQANANLETAVRDSSRSKSEYARAQDEVTRANEKLKQARTAKQVEEAKAELSVANEHLETSRRRVVESENGVIEARKAHNNAKVEVERLKTDVDLASEGIKQRKMAPGVGGKGAVKKNVPSGNTVKPGKGFRTSLRGPAAMLTGAAGTWVANHYADEYKNDQQAYEDEGGEIQKDLDLLNEELDPFGSNNGK